MSRLKTLKYTFAIFDRYLAILETMQDRDTVTSKKRINGPLFAVVLQQY